MRRYLYSLVVIALLTLGPSQPLAAQTTTPFPQSELGPYAVGVTTMTFVDERREVPGRTEDKRELVTEIWYPANYPEGQGKLRAQRDAGPDISGAPYPLIFYSHSEYTRTRLAWPNLMMHLASHGFVVAAVEHPNDSRAVRLIDRPMDILFTLDQLAALTDSELVGVIDTDHVGVIGESLGGYTAFAANGSRIDPVSVRHWAADPLVPGDMTDPRSRVSDWDWDALTAYRAQFSPALDPDEGALWPPFTDDRILAVMPMMGFDGAMFSERGLAAATVPTLLVLGTADDISPYERDVTYFEQMSGSDHYLLTIIDGLHGDSYTYADVPYVFVNVFFGYYLQGREDYAESLTAGYVEQFDRLVWGAYDA